MAKVTVTAFQCDVCGHPWLPKDETKLPERCPSRSCRSVSWNKSASAASAPRYTRTRRPAPQVAMRPPTAAPSTRRSRPAAAPTTEEAKPVYCRHGLNAASCARCRELS